MTIEEMKQWVIANRKGIIVGALGTILLRALIR